MFRIEKTNRIWKKLGLLAAPAVALGVGPATAAQDYDDDYYEDEYYDDGDAFEYEPDEGVHEEEWYDPSDWFDDDFDGTEARTVDYENDWYEDDYVDYDDDYGWVTYEGEQYDAQWWSDSYSTLWTDGYYDGYYDGYADDEFGYDYYEIGEASDAYAEGYEAGYYDGMYDAEMDYDSDWTYYIYTTPASGERARNQRERQGDDMRQRGDRADKAGTAYDRRDRDDARKKQRDMRKNTRDTGRFRGTVASTRKVNLAKDRYSDNVVLKISTDDGKTVLADLGPNAKKSMLDKGDRVTLAGEKLKVDGRKLIDVQRLSVNGETRWNATDQQQPQQASRDMRNRRDGRR